jgi:hypothetical protein
MTFFGPVSAAATDSNPIFGIVGFVAVVTFLSVNLVTAHRRSHAIDLGVAERRWQWIGEALPYYFPTHDLIESTSDFRVQSAFAGVVRGAEFICCDCILGQGRHKTYITLIGVRSALDPFGVKKFDNSYNTTHAGEWFGLTLSGNGWSGSRFMSAKQVFAAIESIG